jgi:hypothetical protein
LLLVVGVRSSYMICAKFSDRLVVGSFGEWTAHD